MESNHLTRPLLALLAVLLCLTLCAVPCVETAPTQTGSPRVGGDTQRKTPQVMFSGNHVLVFPPPLLDRFLQCLCDNNTNDCNMFFEPSPDKSATDPTTKAYRGTKVEIVHGPQFPGPSTGPAPGVTTSYTCRALTAKTFGLLYCTVNETATYNVSGMASVGAAKLDVNLSGGCDFKCVVLEWTSNVQSSNFGQGPTAVTDNAMCILFSDRILYGDCDTCGGTTGRSVDGAASGRVMALIGVTENYDTLNQNASLSPGYKTITIKEDAPKESDITGKIQTAKGKDKLERESSNADDPEKAQLFVIGLGASLVVNIILLVLCIYLCIALRRRTKKSVTLPKQDAFPNQIVDGGDMECEVNENPYQNIDDASRSAIQLHVRQDSGYLTPANAKSSVDGGHSISVSETGTCSSTNKPTDTPHNPSISSDDGNYDSIELLNTAQKPPENVGQRETTPSEKVTPFGGSNNVATLGNHSNHSNHGNHSNHSKQPAKMDEPPAGNTLQQIKPNSIFIRQKDLISDLKMTFDRRPKLVTSPREGSAPKYFPTDRGTATQSPTKGDHQGSEHNDASSPGGFSETPTIPKKPDVPHKPRRSRTLRRNGSAADPGSRPTANSIPESGGVNNESPMCQDNPAFSSSDSDENVYCTLYDS